MKQAPGNRNKRGRLLAVSLAAVVSAFAALLQPARAAEDTAYAAAAATVPIEGSYLGTDKAKGACQKPYRIVGHAPAAPGQYPLFLYFFGTNVTGSAEEADLFQSTTPLRVTEAMAARGYVAYSVQYDNGLATLFGNRKAVVRCLLDASAQGGLIAQLCDQPGSRVDCGKGIVTWGHSLGGAIAIAAKNTEPRVRAAWATGVGGVKGADGAMPVLPKQRIRIVNGSKDAIPLIGWLLGSNNNDARRLTKELALDPAQDCPGQKNQCLRPDGSGWIMVQPEELSPKRDPDHCWFFAITCLKQNASFVEVNFLEGHSRISLSENADWLVRAAATPVP